MRLFGTDLVLLHPPSVYDFRKTRAEYGPISDVIFSTPAFEMYPMGFTTIASHLESNGYNVRIVNIAQRMVSEPDYDAEAAIARLEPALFGIDLHWLPHAHGALRLAELAKRHHPATPVLFGGLSASYFHEELIRSPHVDFVMRGDSTELPMLELIRAVNFHEDLGRIPNLTWKRPDGAPVFNPLSYVAPSMNNGPVPDVFHIVKSVFKYADLNDVIPFKNWLDYPITALLTSRGCSMQCLVCGGSRHAYELNCNRQHSAFRPPDKLVRDMFRIAKFSRAPIFLIHDLRHGGRAYAERILELLEERNPKNEIVLELSSPATDDYLEQVGRSVKRWSLEITLESHIERIRRLNKRFACSNEMIETTIGKALDNGVRRIDIFFMIGLPGQSYDDAVNFDEFCRHLLQRFDGDRRLEFFAAPLAPFLDPGSEAFEDADRNGYRLRFHTLEEHRQALTSSSWKEMLNYETDAMTRDEIVAASYESLRRLTLLKQEWNRINDAECRTALESINASERAVFENKTATGIGSDSDNTSVTITSGKTTADAAAIFQKHYLVWPLIKGRRFASLLSLASTGMRLLLSECRIFTTRRLPLYLAKRKSKRRK